MIIQHLPPIRRAILAINPLSGRFRPDILLEVERFFKDNGLEIKVVANFSALKDMDFSDQDAMAVIGGDGSLNLMINIIGPGTAPICIIPSGTGNALAAELGIKPGNPLRAASLLFEGALRTVDLGRLDGRYFLLVAGIGFDGAVAARITYTQKKRFKLGGYALGAISEIFRYIPSPIEVRTAHGIYSGETVLFCNTKVYGGPLSFAKAALLDDGKLDVVVFKKISLLTGLLYLMMGLGFPHRWTGKYLENFKSPQVELRYQRPVPYQMDGDYYGVSPRWVEVVPRAQQFFVSVT